MPLIPTGDVKMIDTQPPGADIPVHSYGRAGAALEEAGNVVAGAGIDLLQKLKREQTENFAFEQTTELQTYLNDQQNQLKLTAPESREGFAQGFQEIAKNKLQEIEDRAPTREAKAAFRNASRSIIARDMMEAQNYEFVERAKYYVKNDERLINEIRLQIQNKPDATFAMEEMNRTELRVRDGVASGRYTPELGTELIDGSKKLYSRAVFDGMAAADSDKSDILALAYLKSKDDKSGKIASYLDPDDHKRFLNHFQGRYQARQRQKMQLLGLQSDDAKAQVLRGQGDAGKLGQLIDDIKSVPTFDKLSDEIKRREIDSLQNLLKLNNSIKEFKDKPLDQWEDVGKSLETDSSYNAKDRLEAKGYLDRAKIEMLSDIQKDAASVALSQWPSLQKKFAEAQDGEGLSDAIKGLETYQKLMNYPIQARRSVPIEFTQRWGQALAKAPTAEVRGQLIAELQRNAGDRFQSVMQDMIKDKVIDPEFGVIAHLSNSTTIGQVVNNTTNQKPINDAFKSTHGSDTTLGYLVEAHPEIIKLRKSLGGGSDQGLVLSQALRDQVEIEAKRLMTTKTMPMLGAVDQAYKNILEKDFGSVNVNRGSFFVPSRSEGVDVKKAVVQKKLSSYLQDTQSYNFIVPPNIDRVDWYEKILESGRFANLPDNSGVVLVLDWNDGKQTVPITILGADKKPVMFKFKELMLGK